MRVQPRPPQKKGGIYTFSLAVSTASLFSLGGMEKVVRGWTPTSG